MTPAASPASPRPSTRSTRVVRAALALAVLAWLGGGALMGMPPAVLVVLPVLVAALAVAVARRRRATHPEAGPATTVGAAVLATVVVSALIQLVPYGRAHANPPVLAEPAWANPETRALMVRACFDCHSNEVRYPWYANVAPVSWAVQRHVDEGRDAVNYSEWGRGGDDADETIEVTREGEMPPGYYTRFGLHASAKLTDDELRTLLDGLRATPGMSEGREGGDGEGRRHRGDGDDD